MHKIALSLALLTSLAMGSAALAATQSSTDTIKSIDQKAMTITLSNGTVYYLPSSYKVSNLKVGEKVKVDWSMSGTKHEATMVEAAK